MSVITDTLTARAGEPLRGGLLSGGTNATKYENLFMSTTTSTSATFADITGPSVSWTKMYTGSSVRVMVYIGGSASAVPSVTEIGFSINSIDYAVVRQPHRVATEHANWFGQLQISGVAAGTYTCKLRMRRVSGAGTCQVDSNDWTRMRIWEVME